MAELKPDTQHPKFAAQSKHYEMVGDFYRGVGAVREKVETYLPKTAGMLNEQHKNKAEKRYEAYVSRATFPGVFRHTVSSIVGVTTSKEPEDISIPDGWKSIEESATRGGEPLQGVQARTVRELSKTGRFGLLTDLRSDKDETPVLVPFYSGQIINWRTGVINGHKMLTLLVLQKIDSVPGDEYWSDSTKEVIEVYQLTRVGVLLRRFSKEKAENGKKTEWIEEPNVPQPRMKRQWPGAESITTAGGATGFRLPEIPFTSITPMGLQIEPSDPPFLDLVYKLWDIYGGSANYREALSMYEPTPVVTGMTEEWIKGGYAPRYMGVGAVWHLPEGSQATMLEYTGNTISDIRQALIDDAKEADRLAAQPFEQITSQVESGQAKEKRAQAKTNVIREIHKSAGAGIQEALRKGARWTGDDDSKVFYTVSDDLDDTIMPADELRELTGSWMAGLVPDVDAHAQLKSGGRTILTYEEWTAAREGGETGAFPDGMGQPNNGA